MDTGMLVYIFTHAHTHLNTHGTHALTHMHSRAHMHARTYTHACFRGCGWRAEVDVGIHCVGHTRALTMHTPTPIDVHAHTCTHTTQMYMCVHCHPVVPCFILPCPALVCLTDAIMYIFLHYIHYYYLLFCSNTCMVKHGQHVPARTHTHARTCSHTHTHTYTHAHTIHMHSCTHMHAHTHQHIRFALLCSVSLRLSWRLCA